MKMKTKLFSFLVLLFISATTVAQSNRIIDSKEYDQLKKANQLPEKFLLKETSAGHDVIMPRIQPSANTIQSNAICNCLLPLDTSYSVVPFSSGTAPYYRNDDGSSPAIVLPFSYCFFGQSFDTVYINNNGNISFHSPLFNFISDSFPNSTYTMIAPLWADVDTRGALSGLVYYKVTPTAVIVKWEHVGYFPMRDDQLNTYQIILTNGADPIVPSGNTAFCYGDMQWTSGGVAFGSPATAGANAGDGTNFIQFGRFNGPGYGYDGPFGASDSVDWLDSSSFSFNMCPANVPPIPFDCNTDTVFLRVGDVTDIDVSFFAPEFGQSTSIAINTGGLVNLTTLSQTSGNLSRFNGRLVASSANIGTNVMTLTATDNGTPPQTFSVHRVFQIEQATGIPSNDFSPMISFSPNPFSDQTTLTIEGLNGKNISLIISDITGREVMRIANVPSKSLIEKGDLMKGIYLYQLTDGDSMKATGKLVIR